jgi:hypothetical protein
VGARAFRDAAVDIPILVGVDVHVDVCQGNQMSRRNQFLVASLVIMGCSIVNSLKIHDWIALIENRGPLSSVQALAAGWVWCLFLNRNLPSQEHQ